VSRKLYTDCARSKPAPVEAEFQTGKGRDGWSTDQIATKHDTMVENPKELADILAAFTAA